MKEQKSNRGKKQNLRLTKESTRNLFSVDSLDFWTIDVISHLSIEKKKIRIFRFWRRSFFCPISIPVTSFRVWPNLKQNGRWTHAKHKVKLRNVLVERGSREQKKITTTIIHSGDKFSFKLRNPKNVKRTLGGVCVCVCTFYPKFLYSTKEKKKEIFPEKKMKENKRKLTTWAVLQLSSLTLRSEDLWAGPPNRPCVYSPSFAPCVSTRDTITTRPKK